MHNEAAIDQWRALRVGLFIHWGPSAGRALPQSHSHARQSALNPHGSVPAAVYDQFYLEFNPTAYDPDGWLQLAYAAGMRYTVFVAKHHDGFCLFDSAATAYSIMATPYGKDVAALFAAACRRQGLALGWQISPKDWKHPDFSTADHARYNDFYTAIMAELATKYGPIAVMWFDGIDPVGPDQWQDAPEQIATMLRHHSPEPVQSPMAPSTLVATKAPSAMNKPWPKLSTSMRPNTSVKPEAMMKMIMPMARPATVSVSQVEPEPIRGNASKASTGTSSKGRMSTS